MLFWGLVDPKLNPNFKKQHEVQVGVRHLALSFSPMSPLVEHALDALDDVLGFGAHEDDDGAVLHDLVAFAFVA